MNSEDPNKKSQESDNINAFSTSSGDFFTFKKNDTSSIYVTPQSYTDGNVKQASETSTNVSQTLNVPELIRQLAKESELQTQEKLNERLNKELSSIKSTLTKISNEKQKELKDTFDSEKNNLVKISTEFKKDLQEVKNSVLATIAIFASFFTFISVTINIFSKATITESIGLMIVLWCCIFTFTYTFFIFTFNKYSQKRFWIPFFICLGCAVISLYWVSYTKSIDKINTPPANIDLQKQRNNTNEAATHPKPI